MIAQDIYLMAAIPGIALVLTILAFWQHQVILFAVAAFFWFALSFKLFAAPFSEPMLAIPALGMAIWLLFACVMEIKEERG